MSTELNINTLSGLENHYRSYIKAINSLPSSTLDPYLAETINHNDKQLSKLEYHDLIIPKSIFKILDIVTDLEKRKISARLDITLGNGKKVKENVFYQFNEGWEIERVWSMVEFL
ncbi:uncharacterized protein L201_007931 [Kwoniella dendrophila CBS 6074]|uniref:Uncharacterized protein n=1 Tax=Kwoniella dendrophila CBS 6074 TaxID=1295534 RepID=A0AAX4K836_9TREE